MKELFGKSYKILVKEFENETNGNISYIIGLEDWMAEIPTLSKAIYKFNVITIKILKTFFI